MKHLFAHVALVTTLAIGGSAAAADLQPRGYVKAPAFTASATNWAGFYIGANGGWASARTCWDFVGVPGVPLPLVPEGCHDASGGVIGGQIGYLFQTGAYVFGVEAQGNWADLRGSNDPAAFPGTTNRTEVNGFGLFTGKLGYAWNNVLAYAKGGAAVVHDRFDFRFTGAAAPLAVTSETRWGGAVGAGLEYAFHPNWSVGLEYDHVFLGQRDVTFGPSVLSAAGVVERIKQDLDIVTVRLNYRFGGPVSARF